MKICSAHSKLKKYLTIVTLTEFWKLYATSNISPETVELIIWIVLKRWGRDVFVKSRTFKCEREMNDHMLHYEHVFGNVLERRESKCCAVLMKHCCKVKSEQVITLQIVQQLKAKKY